MLHGITAPMNDAELTLALGVWYEFAEDIPTSQLLAAFHSAVKAAKVKRDVGVVLMATSYRAMLAAEETSYVNAAEYLSLLREGEADSF